MTAVWSVMLSRTGIQIRRTCQMTCCAQSTPWSSICCTVPISDTLKIQTLNGKQVWHYTSRTAYFTIRNQNVICGVKTKNKATVLTTIWNFCIRTFVWLHYFTFKTLVCTLLSTVERWREFWRLGSATLVDWTPFWQSVVDFLSASWDVLPSSDISEVCLRLQLQRSRDASPAHFASFGNFRKHSARDLAAEPGNIKTLQKYFRKHMHCKPVLRR